MSTEAIAAPARPARAGAAIAWALLICCFALLIIGLVLGERTSTYGELRQDVASGDVDSVVVTGGTTAPFIGRMTATVHWRDGLFRYQAPVVEQHPQRRTETRAGVPVVYSVERDLAGRGGLVSVERRPHDFPDYNEIYGWRLPHWTEAATLAIGVTGLLLLIAGPQPRRATRWAWFWLMSVAPPAGFLAFLVLSGQLSLRPQADVAPRLTGGFAFVLAVLIGLATNVAAGAIL